MALTCLKKYVFKHNYDYWLMYGKVIFVIGISIGRNMTHNNIFFKDASQIITYKIHYYIFLFMGYCLS